MDDVKEALYLSYKSEADAFKMRNLALLYALQEIERERVAMYAALVDGNRCADCAHLEICSKKEFGLYHIKEKSPENYCVKWQYKGAYTGIDDIVRLSINERRKGGNVNEDRT